MKILYAGLICISVYLLGFVTQALACTYGLPGPVRYIPMGNAKRRYESYTDFLKDELGSSEWKQINFTYKYKKRHDMPPTSYENKYLTISRPSIAENIENVIMNIDFKDNELINQTLSIYYETKADVFSYYEYGEYDINDRCGGEYYCDHWHSDIYGKIGTFHVDTSVKWISLRIRQIGEAGKYIFILEGTRPETNNNEIYVMRTKKVYWPYPCSPSIIHYYYFKPDS